MSDIPTLEKLVAVGPRFTRSISLVADAYRRSAIEGYILTPTGRAVLDRLAAALRGDSSTRAWSLIGPYGSGKSAFALFAAQLLTGEEAIRLKARDVLASADADLWERFFGQGSRLPKKAGRLLPVLVTGSRQPLEKALAERLADSLRALGKSKPRKIVEQLEQLADLEVPPGSAVVRLFEEVNEFLEGSEYAAGLLLIVDELGKFLEYAASNPEQSDVFVLQELAETATRSRRPFLVLTVLHQALDRYAEHMSAGRRAEWAKVRGRFEDVPFEERTEQILQLLAHAIQPEGDDFQRNALQRKARALAREAVAQGLRCGSMGAAQLEECLTACYPLHPVTALIVGPLFRQLAQNERSLFAFLASPEPAGFQEFLRETSLDGGAYRLDNLYDYVMASLGPSLYAQHRGKLWAEVQSTLERLHDASDLEVRLAKCIGLLQALGAGSGIPASRDTLRLALKDAAQDVAIFEAIDSLSHRSVVVYRHHRASYALWEGSDIDIEDRLEAARKSVQQDQNLAAFLTHQFPVQPLIARRHYFRTGTLRYFEVCYADRGGLQADLFRGFLVTDLRGADGRLVYCLPRDAEDRATMRGLTESPGELPAIVALPQDLSNLRELCHDLVCLRWVKEHTPELESDRTARRELCARLALAEQDLRSHLEWVFSPANKACAWYYRGKEIRLSSQRGLNDLLSKVCEEVYSATPNWRNELINRRSLSSSAAAARRNLIEAMFERADQEGLGFKGNPPERSMYETLLKGSRLHRKQGGAFGFYPPDAKAEEAVRKLWQTIDGFLAETDSGRRSVAELFGLLRRPPFGLKDGILPVLLAAVLVHGYTQLALYEDGTFVPRPNAAVFERLFRAPQKFEVQRFCIAGARAEVFQQYAAMLTRTEAGSPNLLDVVRPLVRAVRELPEYAGKTRQISETAQGVLRALREAREPDRLLFVDLPGACGVSGFAASGEVSAGEVTAYFDRMRSAFAELRRAYPDLLAEIERLILKAFGQERPLANARQQIEHDAGLVLNVAVDPKLKAFLMRAADSMVENTTWLESIATLLAGKPPTHWDDQDRARFEIQLAAAARTFEHFRVLAFEMARTGAALLDGDKEMLRISISSPDGGEVERVVKVPPSLSPQAARAKEEVRRVLQEQNLLDAREASVAVLAQIARQLLSEGHED